MAYEVESPSETEAQVRITVTPAEVQKAFDGQFRKLAQQVKLPGFRPGKIPRKILEKKFGGEVEQEVLQNLIESEVRAAIQEHELMPLEPPRIEKEQLVRNAEGGLLLELKVQVVPSFELPDYKSLQIPTPAIEVKEEDVEKQLEQARAQAARLEDAGQGPAAPGDMIKADLTYQFLDGSSLPVMEDRLIDTHSGILDGFACTQAIGAFAGQTVGSRVKITMDLPKDHPLEEHREKTSVIECLVKEIHQVHLPELESAEFLEQFGVKTTAELRERIRSHLRSRLEGQRNRMVEETCIEQLLDRCHFPISAEFLQRMVENEKQRSREQAAEQGADSAQVEQDLLMRESRMQADLEKGLRAAILLDRIADAEEIKVEDRDIQVHFQLMSRTMQMPAQDLFNYYAESGQLSQLVGSLRRDKVRNFLRTSATMTEEMERGRGSEQPSPPSTQAEEEEN